MTTELPVHDSDETFLADICKGLGHPARIRILKQLLTENRCVCGRIVEVMPLAQSTVSQHLKILKECGLVQGEVEGSRTCYCVNPETLARFAPLINGLLARIRESEAA